MAKKKKTIPKLKTELDKWFSLYIRLRNADDKGMVECFTCGSLKNYKEQQCGHFQSRRHNATRWDETNCQVQDAKCNIFSQGEQFKFAQKLDEVYGEGTAESLQIKAQQTTKLTRAELLEDIEKYKNLVKIKLI